MASFFPSAMQSFSELLVAAKRIHDFFRLPEVNQSFSTKATSIPGGEITIENGNYGWYSAQSGYDKHQEQTTILETILVKACFVVSASFQLCLCIDWVEEKEYALARVSIACSDID